jgi:hypothetical protein
VPPPRPPDPPSRAPPPTRPPLGKRLPPQPATPFTPVRQPQPLYVAAPMDLPPRPRPRVVTAPAEQRFDSIGPAVPGLVWFVQHHLPMLLSRRHPEWPPLSADLDRANLGPDDRDCEHGDDEGDADVTGG